MAELVVEQFEDRIFDPSNDKVYAPMCKRVKGDMMRHSEKRCRKLCMGEVDLSPETNLAGKRYATWKLIWKWREGRKVRSSKIKRAAKDCGIITE